MLTTVNRLEEYSVNEIRVSNLKEVKKRKNYKLVKFMIDDLHVAFVKKGELGDKIGYCCIVENKTNQYSSWHDYRVYDFDGGIVEFNNIVSSYNVNEFFIKIPMQNNLARIGNTDYYGYITIESSKEISLSNLVCDDFNIEFQQIKSSKISADGKIYYIDIKIKLLDLDDLPGQTIYFSFYIDIFKGNNTTNKIMTKHINVNLYYSSGAPEGD